MKEDFRWINLVAREQGRLEVDEEDIRLICMVACGEGQWEVDEEDDRDERGAQVNGCVAWVEGQDGCPVGLGLLWVFLRCIYVRVFFFFWCSL
jgi:hypothetical protein